MTGELKAPALDPAEVPAREGSTGYPEPFRELCRGRTKRVLGDALRLDNFGVNLVTLAPGAGSAQRHWHSHEDEFVYVVAGELTLVTEGGEQVLAAGQAAGFPAGRADGHHLINRSAATATYLEVGGRNAEDVCSYPDIDLRLAPTPDGHVFANKKGEPY